LTDRAEDIATDPGAVAPCAGPDNVSVGRWFAAYGLFLLLAGGAAALLLAREPWAWSEWRSRPAEELLATTSDGAKLLLYAVYMSLCCTFLPLPTGWIVAALATREAAVGPNAAATALLVAAVGAAGSTIANLTDYHAFTWLLRWRRIGQVRRTRLYDFSARWFASAPFLILVIFNIVPIPVDVIRMLATTYRYPRGPFAAANFAGRFVRYGVIAYVTYWLNLGRWAVLVLLALAVALGLSKAVPAAVRRIRRRAPNNAAPGVSTIRQELQE
jgi:membrane protein YqaA with SNARE-associated domain